MRKEMTPCEMLGYKVGDEFEVIRHYAFKNGQVVTLHEDDGTECPLFAGDGGGAGVFDGVECSFATLNKQVRKIANKLKPAKQSLADAIHQNGGWPKECHWMFAASNGFGSAFCWTNKPKRSGLNWLGGGKFTPCCEIGASIPNWHQCILSRDEYFTAYPEQVNVEVGNETGRKVEVEMESESEVTIKVSDWHKNGELPPVGEVCEAFVYEDDSWSEVEIIAHKDGIAIGWSSIDQLTHQSRNEKSFRPLRTERDKAIDEMVCEFIDHYGDPKGGERYLGIAAKLYDAGYRKEVK